MNLQPVNSLAATCVTPGCELEGQLFTAPPGMLFDRGEESVMCGGCNQWMVFVDDSDSFRAAR